MTVFTWKFVEWKWLHDLLKHLEHVRSHRLVHFHSYRPPRKFFSDNDSTLYIAVLQVELLEQVLLPKTAETAKILVEIILINESFSIQIIRKQ